jgi:hypothetical protein
MIEPNDLFSRLKEEDSVTDFRYTPEGPIARIDSVWWRVFGERNNIVAIIDFLTEAEYRKYGVDIGHQVNKT